LGCTFVSQQNNVGVEVGVSNRKGSFTKLADAKGMTLVEKRSVAAPDPWPGTVDLASEMKLSTAGLGRVAQALQRATVPLGNQARDVESKKFHCGFSIL
jgi:hypothetical protein